MKINAVLSTILTALTLTSRLFAGGEDDSRKCKLKFSGFVKLEAFYDNTQVAQGDWLLFVKPGDSPESEQDVFSMNARHSRVNMKLDGPEFSSDGVVKGFIEADFAGGFPNSSTAARQPLMRLRHAWIELNTPKWEARFGQDWALIAEPFPNTTSFVVGAGKGNLWMRYPQIRLTVKQNAMKYALSVNRPMAGNSKYDNYAGGSFDIVGDGEMTGIPWVMGRCWYTAGDIVCSISGHYGQEQIDDLSGNPHDTDTYSVNGDIKAKFGKLSLIARGFAGENLNSFFGGVFQGFTRSAVSVSNIASFGGWGQAMYEIDEDWSVTIGGGFDDPDDDDLTNGNRSKNDWLFGNVAYNIKKAVVFMLEAEYLKTSYIDDEAGENLRCQFVTYYKF
jgi:hypothetical protein